MSTFRTYFSSLLPLMFLACAWADVAPQGAMVVPHPARFFILSPSGAHYPKLRAALSLVGFSVEEGDYAAYVAASKDERLALVLTARESLRLTEAQCAGVLADVQAGGFLILDGASPLVARLGFANTTSTKPLTGYRWSRYPHVPISLPEPTVCPRLLMPANTLLGDFPAENPVLADDPASKAPLVIAGEFGRGHYLIDALPLEPAKYALYQYQPFVLEAITKVGKLMPALAGTDLGVYIDYGYHDDERPEALVDRLKAWGIRQAAFSAWYDSDEYHVFVHRFLAAAHRQGIQVEAWLELPMVSRTFWMQHPEWRQRTASGRPAQVDWRYLMALENPQCLRAVEGYVANQIMGHDWDGVNLAEVYFESPAVGFDSAKTFTPMNDLAIQQFQARYGVDPRKLFDPKSPHFWQKDARLRQAMIQFRVDYVTMLHRKLLDMCLRCKTRRPDLHLTVTQIDTLLLPSMREQIGVDIPQLLALQKRYGFDIQLEDPYTLWNLGAGRFRVIGELYRKRLPAGTPLALDINVVARVPDTPEQILVTARQRGLELYELLAAVSEHADLVYLYAANTLATPDMRLAPFAAASPRLTSLPDGQVQYTSARQLAWMVDTRGMAAVLDGQPWPCLADDRVWLPAGTHTIALQQLLPYAAPALRVVEINGAIREARQDGAACSIRYQSAGRCYLTFSAVPATITCDGKPFTGKPVPGAGRAIYAFPAGEHTLGAQASSLSR